MNTPRILSRVANRRFRMPLLLAAALGVLMVVFVPLAAGDSEHDVKGAIYLSQTQASPGDNLTFWIWVQPLKDKAKRLVITESPLDGLSIDSSAAPSSCLETGRTWVCIQDDLSPFSIEVRATVGSNTSEKDLQYAAQIKIWEKNGKTDDDEKHTVAVSAKVHIVPRVEVEEPKVEVQLDAMQATVIPGGELNYMVEVINRGTASARNVSVVVVVPSAIVLTSASQWPTRDEDLLTWLLASVPVGTMDLFFNATLPASAHLDRVELGVVATYGDQSGQPVRVEAMPTFVPILPAPPGPAASPGPAAVGLVVVAFVLRCIILPNGPITTWMGTGADQIFLLHRSGVLLKHLASRRAREMDSDILGGMLSAVRMFVEDSIDPAAGPLREIRFGGGSIVFVTGRNAALAAVYPRGNRARFGERAMGLLQEFEALNDAALTNFDGLPAPLKGIDSLLARVAG